MLVPPYLEECQCKAYWSYDADMPEDYDETTICEFDSMLCLEETDMVTT